MAKNVLSKQGRALDLTAKIATADIFYSYNKKRKNNLIQNEFTSSHQQTKTEHDNNNYNNRTILVGPSFSGETYLMLTILSRIANRDIYIITKSPPEQYSNSKIRIKEKSDETKPLSQYENGIIVSDDILGSSSSRFMDQFFNRGCHNDLDIFYLSQSYFDLPKRTFRNNSDKNILFNQTLKDIEHIYRDVSGYDMSYYEFRGLCRKAWDENYNYLCIDWCKKKRSRKILYIKWKQEQLHWMYSEDTAFLIKLNVAFI